MWKRFLLDAVLVLLFSFVGSTLAFFVYKKYFAVDYYVIDTGKIFQVNVSYKDVYEYMRANPGIYLDRYCVIYAPPDKDITRRLLDEVKKGK